MIFEWAAVQAAVSPFVGKYLSSKASELADHGLQGLWKRLSSDSAALQANKAFVERFSTELEGANFFTTTTAKPYQDALGNFLRNASVQDAILRPLDGESELDWRMLRGVWREMKLLEPPEEFRWRTVARNYAASVKKLVVANAELRPVFEALAARRTADAAERLAGPAQSFDLDRYAKAIREAYEYLKLGSVATDWARYERRISLRSVYTPQSVKQALPPKDVTRDYLEKLQEKGLEVDPEELEERKRNYLDLSATPVLEVVDDPRNERLVILGDPRLGKSTLLRLLALRAAHDRSRPPAFYLELRFALSKHKTFLACWEQGESPTCCLPQNELDRFLKSEPSLVLFDALDEVDAAWRDDTVGAILKFAERYPKARIVVTTRIYGYYPGSTHWEQFRDAGFEQVTLQDFDDDEIQRFVKAWHEEAFDDPAERTQYEGRVRRGLEESPAIRELAANPLLLTLMAILARTQDLPRDRVKLYERCAQLLLQDWELATFAVRDKLGLDQKMRILQRVAATIQEESTGLAGNLIGEGKLKEVIEAQLRELAVPQSWRETEELIRKLRERNFMLAYLGDGQYGFVHRTFLEYFRAAEICYRLEKTAELREVDLVRLFRERWAAPEWQEPLRLVCGMVGAERAGQCIEALLEQETESKGQKAVFLASECLREVREEGVIFEVRKRAREAIIGQCSPPVSDPPIGLAAMVEEEITRDIRRAVAELANTWGEDWQTHRWLRHAAAEGDRYALRDAAIQELAWRWKDDPETLPLLSALAESDEHWAVRKAALRELARGWKDDPETLLLLRALAESDEHWAVREAAVQELAQGWKDDPETLLLLRALAESDEHPNDSRVTALRELARGWKDDPETLPLLRALAEIDKDEDVREAAVGELVRGWKNDAGTLPLLRARAEGDENAGVRAAAVERLAQGWKEEAGTLPLLRALAESDEHWAVREAALRELARGWKEDAGTLPLICARAGSDEDEDVRAVAVDELARAWKDDPEVQRFLESLRENRRPPDTE